MPWRAAQHTYAVMAQMLWTRKDFGTSAIVIHASIHHGWTNKLARLHQSTPTATEHIATKGLDGCSWLLI